MAVDDDADCVEHQWVLVGVALVSGSGAPTEYECVRRGCRAVLYRGADDPFPQTVRLD